MMKNGDVEVSNWVAFPALELLCHRLKTGNPECSLTVYETHQGHYRLYLTAKEQFPFFKLDALFEATLWGHAFLISELSIAMDGRRQCYILLQKTEPLPPTRPRSKKRTARQ